MNAAVGHSAGDVLLAQVGRRLRAAVPPAGHGGPVGWRRVPAVLIEGTVSAEEVADIAERLTRSVASPPFRAGRWPISPTVSVGVALSGEGPAGDVWRKVDMAMSRAKEQGGGQVEIYAGTGRGWGTPPGRACGQVTPGIRPALAREPGRGWRGARPGLRRAPRSAVRLGSRTPPPTDRGGAVSHIPRRICPQVDGFGPMAHSGLRAFRPNSRTCQARGSLTSHPRAPLDCPRARGVFCCQRPPVDEEPFR